VVKTPYMNPFNASYLVEAVDSRNILIRNGTNGTLMNGSEEYFYMMREFGYDDDDDNPNPTVHYQRSPHFDAMITNGLDIRNLIYSQRERIVEHEGENITLGRYLPRFEDVCCTLVTELSS
jgi:hypothetical protein